MTKPRAKTKEEAREEFEERFDLWCGEAVV